jgi:iron(III) transport system permease protein
VQDHRCRRSAARRPRRCARGPRGAPAPQARPPEAYGLDNFAGLGRYAHIFGNTLLVAAVATVLAVVVGFTMGWILSRTNVPGRGALEQLMAMPYYVTPLMGALAWSLVGSPSGGFINQVWRAVGGESHLIDVTTPGGIAWVMALFEGSVAFVMIGAVMKSMDPALEEASQVLGAGRIRTMLIEFDQRLAKGDERWHAVSTRRRFAHRDGSARNAAP